MGERGYVPEVEALQKRIAMFVPKLALRYPRWISTPDGDQGDEWCSDCGYYMMRHLRHRDRKRREDYFLDGGWRTEEDHFCHCRGCGVRLDVSLTDWGVDDTIQMYGECGFSTAPGEDAWEINELLGRVEFRFGDDEEDERRRHEVTSLAERFLAQAEVRHG